MHILVAALVSLVAGLPFFSGAGFQPVKPTGWKPVPLWLPREAALFLLRPERKRRNSHAEIFHGVYLSEADG